MAASKEDIGPVTAFRDQFSKWGILDEKKEALLNELEAEQHMHKDGQRTRQEESVRYLKTKAECQRLHAVSKMLDNAVSKKKKELEMVTQELEIANQKLQAQSFSGHKSSLSSLAAKSRLIDDSESHSSDHADLDCAWPALTGKGRAQRQYPSGWGMTAATTNLNNDDWGCDKASDAISWAEDAGSHGCSGVNLSPSNGW